MEFFRPSGWVGIFWASVGYLKLTLYLPIILYNLDSWWNSFSFNVLPINPHTWAPRLCPMQFLLEEDDNWCIGGIWWLSKARYLPMTIVFTADSPYLKTFLAPKFQSTNPIKTCLFSKISFTVPTIHYIRHCIQMFWE